MRVVFLIELVTEDGARSNLHKTIAKASIRLYSNMCLAFCQFNFALSESFCLDISSFCYSDSLTQVSGNGFPSSPCCGLSAPSSGAGCGPDAVVPVRFWLCWCSAQMGPVVGIWPAPSAPVWRAISLHHLARVLRATLQSDVGFPQEKQETPEIGHPFLVAPSEFVPLVAAMHAES